MAFRPIWREPFEDVIEIVCQRGSFAVPLKACLPAAKLQVCHFSACRGHSIDHAHIHTIAAVYSVTSQLMYSELNPWLLIHHPFPYPHCLWYLSCGRHLYRCAMTRHHCLQCSIVSCTAGALPATAHCIARHRHHLLFPLYRVILL